MRKIILYIIALFFVQTVLAQQDLIDKVTKQAVEIDSLKRAINSLNIVNTTTIKDYEDSLKELNESNVNLLSKVSTIDSLSVLEKSLKSQLIQKSDSIFKLKAFIKEKENMLLTAEAFYKVKDILAQRYLSKDFDELIQSSTLNSIQRDATLLDDNSEVTSILTDLEKYFEAKNAIGLKLDDILLKNSLIDINKIERESTLLNKLRKDIENYPAFADDLKSSIERIIDLDSKETVIGMNSEIQKMKHAKIMNEISEYIFGFDFQLVDYPYLSNIIFEVLKEKQPNPDADISFLLKRF